MLAIVALIASAVAAAARELHGRPTVSVLGAITFAIILALVGLGLRRVLFQRPGYFSYFAISFLALWEGAQLIPTLLNGFVLAAVPAFIARAATVVCLGCGVALLLLAFRLVDREEPDSFDGDDPGNDYDIEDAGARESLA